MIGAGAGGALIGKSAALMGPAVQPSARSKAADAAAAAASENRRMVVPHHKSTQSACNNLLPPRHTPRFFSRSLPPAACRRKLRRALAIVPCVAARLAKSVHT